MSDNREERITFRVDPQTAKALDRYLDASKRKKSDVVHDALHRFLLDNDPQYRAEVTGTAETGSGRLYDQITTDSSFPLAAEPSSPPFFPSDAPPASPGDSSLRSVG